MAITGDRYVGDFEGHVIELVRNNWTKVFSLVVDGQVVAKERCDLPHNIELRFAFEMSGEAHELIGFSHVKKVLGLPLDADDGVLIDGRVLPLVKVK
jgi:hypothetical protein